MRIRTKLLIAFILVAVVPAGVTGAVAYGLAQDASQDQVHAQLEALARVQEERVVDAIAQNFESLVLVAGRPGLVEGLTEYNRTSNPAALEAVNGSVAAANASVGRFDKVSVTTWDGVVVATTNMSDIGRDRSVELRQWGAADGPVLRLEQGPGPSLRQNAATAIHSDGVLVGYLIILSEAETIVDVVTDRTGLGSTGETLIAAEGPGGQAVVLTPTRFAQPSFPGPADAPSALAAKGEEAVLEDAQDYRGERVIAATRYIETQGWGLVVKMDRDEAYAPVVLLARSVAAAAGLSVLLGVVVAALVADRLSRPLVHLTRVADDIAAGDLTRRAYLASRDEVGALAQDFNRMADTLVNANAALEARVSERTRELEQSHRELTEFAQIASHDLHAPLRHVAGFTHLLAAHRGDDADDDERRYFDAIDHAVEEARGLTSALLAFTRASAREFVPQPVDLNEVVDEAMAAHAERIRDERAAVTVARLPVVLGDAAQLRVVFHHLLENALKFHGDAPPKVTIGASPADDAWRITVSDAGIGIDRKYHERVWDLFGRLHAKTDAAGSGIGLALVRRIIERHMGRVGLESAPGEGTTVWFTLPPASPPRSDGGLAPSRAT